MKLHTKLIFTSLSILLCSASGQNFKSPANPEPSSNTLDVMRLYTASGWMGDGKEGKKYVQVDEVCKISPRPKRQTCTKITYTIGPAGWAGIYWLNKADNWGDEHGEDLNSRGFKRVTFWARGERGHEIVEFKTGGVSEAAKHDKDSFEGTTGKVSLETDWKKYNINIEGQNLSDVIGLFCWSASETSNPSGLIFYLDQIQFE